MPTKEIMLGGPSAKPPMSPMPMDEPSGAGDIPLEGEHPSVYLPNATGAPDYLAPGYEGAISFRVRVIDRQDNGIELELLSMTPDSAPAARDPMGGAAMERNWRDAEEAQQDDF